MNEYGRIKTCLQNPFIYALARCEQYRGVKEKLTALLEKIESGCILTEGEADDLWLIEDHLQRYQPRIIPAIVNGEEHQILLMTRVNI